MIRRDRGRISPASVGSTSTLDAMWFGASEAAAQSSRFAAQAIQTLVAKMATFAERRRALAHLRRLDDRMLKDIGINRCEIMSVVYGHDKDRARHRPGCR